MRMLHCTALSRCEVDSVWFCTMGTGSHWDVLGPRRKRQRLHAVGSLRWQLAAERLRAITAIYRWWPLHATPHPSNVDEVTGPRAEPSADDAVE